MDIKFLFILYFPLFSILKLLTVTKPDEFFDNFPYKTIIFNSIE